MDKFASIPNISCDLLRYVKISTTNEASSNHLQPILDSMFPPRVETKEDGSQIHLRVSSLPVTRHELANLKWRLNTALTEQHQAKLVGLCPIRRLIYDQCFDELIRQVTIGCVEQGLLLFQVRNEIRMTLAAYKRIYESGVAFGMRKAIQNDEVLTEAKERIEILEKERKLLNQQVENSIRDERTSEMNHKQILDNIKSQYQEEIKNKERIIEQQRNMIKALNRRTLDIGN